MFSAVEIPTLLIKKASQTTLLTPQLDLKPHWDDDVQKESPRKEVATTYHRRPPEPSPINVAVAPSCR